MPPSLGDTMDRRCWLDGFIVCLHVISITSLHPLSYFILLLLRLLLFPIKLPHSDILAPSMRIMPLQQAAKTEIVLGNDLFEIESRLAPLHYPRFGQFAAI